MASWMSRCTQSPQGEDSGAPPWPMSLALANANVGAAALDNATVVAATNYVNHTPSP